MRVGPKLILYHLRTFCFGELSKKSNMKTLQTLKFTVFSSVGVTRLELAASTSLK